MIADRPLQTRSTLRRDLEALGVGAGDHVMVHASIRRVGPVLGGPDVLIGALRDAAGAQGTILAYADWGVAYDALLDADGRVPDRWRDSIPTFDPAVSRAAPEYGIFPEFLRTTPGALRSGNPGASVVALGARALHFTADHPLDYGYGVNSPFARLVAAGGKVLMLGAPIDTMTLLHHAEHLAVIANKRIKRYEAPLAVSGGRQWRRIEEYDTSEPVSRALPDDCFARIVGDYLALGCGFRHRVGRADSILIDAGEITSFAIRWLEDWPGDRLS